MMNQQNQQLPTPYERFQENVNIAQAFLYVSSIPLLVIFRHSLGNRIFANLFRGFGFFVFFSGGIGIIALLFIISGFVSQGNPAFLVLFLISTVFLMLWHRAAMLFRRKEVHSLFLGESWLEKLLPFLPYAVVQSFIEPALAAAIGLGVSAVNAPLGIFLIWSAISLCFVQLQAGRNTKEEMQRMKDEEIRAKQIEQKLNTPPEDETPASRVRVHQPRN